VPTLRETQRTVALAGGRALAASSVRTANAIARPGRPFAMARVSTRRAIQRIVAPATPLARRMKFVRARAVHPIVLRARRNAANPVSILRRTPRIAAAVAFHVRWVRLARPVSAAAPATLPPVPAAVSAPPATHCIAVAATSRAPPDNPAAADNACVRPGLPSAATPVSIREPTRATAMPATRLV
jgi:hypothetical protein